MQISSASKKPQVTAQASRKELLAAEILQHFLFTCLHPSFGTSTHSSPCCGSCRSGNVPGREEPVPPMQELLTPQGFIPPMGMLSWLQLRCCGGRSCSRQTNGSLRVSAEITTHPGTHSLNLTLVRRCSPVLQNVSFSFSCPSSSWPGVRGNPNSRSSSGLYHGPLTS